MAGLLILAACGTAPVQIGSFRLQSPTAILESSGLEQVFVAVYTEDRIEGASAFSEIEPGFRSMVEPRIPEDHPLLELWQQRLARLQSLSREPDATPFELAWVGSELPFQAAVDDAVRTLVGVDSARATAALDHAERLGASRSARFQLLEIALQDPRIDPISAASWMRSFFAENNPPAIRVLALSSQCGEPAATAGMLQLDHLAIADRSDLYGTLAIHLVDRPDRASLLLDSLARIPRHGRGPATAGLLSHPDGSSALHLGVVVRLTELPYRDRLGLLLAVVRGPHFTGKVQVASVRAAQAMDEPERQIALDEISGSSRLEAEARELLVR